MIKVIHIEELDWKEERSAIIEVRIGHKRKTTKFEISFYEICHYQHCPLFSICNEKAETDQALCEQMSKSPKVKNFLSMHNVGYRILTPVQKL